MKLIKSNLDVLGFVAFVAVLSLFYIVVGA